MAASLTTAPSSSRCSCSGPTGSLKDATLPARSNWAATARIAFQSAGKVHLRSRNDKDFNARYPAIVKALSGMPDETVIDGEIVALASSGRPRFNAVPNAYIRTVTSGVGTTPASFGRSNSALRLRLVWSLSLLELVATNSSATIGAKAPEL